MKNTLTGRGVIVWLLAFFGIIFVINAVFIGVAVKTFTGDDADDSYLQGVEYNHTLAQRAEQEKLGWHATIAADRLSTGNVRIGVVLKQADGAPETKVALLGTLHHPSDETKDRPLHLRQIAPGEYVADLDGVGTGAWDVIVTTPAKAETPFEASRRLWVR
jgi:nitrogen fixation protein FixH